LQWAEARSTQVAPGEYAAGTRRRFPEFASLNDRELFDEIAKRLPDSFGVPPILRSRQSDVSTLQTRLASNPEGIWIDDGGLESRARVPVPPLTIAVGRDGTYYMTAGTENVSTQDISYLVNAQLRRSGSRLAGTVTVGYYMRSASERNACASSGTMDLTLSADGEGLSGTSVLSRQPDSVPAPFAVLCSALPSGTRTIRLTRQLGQ
jgi:hypothetical protein